MSKLLIFDDDEDILSICVFIFEELGWQVKSYPTCKDHLERIRAFAPDVILMDNWIPEEGGIAATQQIKSVPALAKIPVIFFSANSNVGALANEAGAEYYLSKPFELDWLKEVVSRAVK